MHDQLPRDATLAVIIGRMRDPIEFVRRVLENMKECEVKFRKPAVVRIGITGEGVVPHYRIEPEEGLGKAVSRELLSGSREELDRETAKTRTEFYRAYNGSNHEHQAAWTYRELQDGSWSRHSMNVAAVRKLLGELRGYRRK